LNSKSSCLSLLLVLQRCTAIPAFPVSLLQEPCLPWAQPHNPDLSPHFQVLTLIWCKGPCSQLLAIRSLRPHYCHRPEPRPVDQELETATLFFILGSLPPALFTLHYEAEAQKGLGDMLRPGELVSPTPYSGSGPVLPVPPCASPTYIRINATRTAFQFPGPQSWRGQRVREPEQWGWTYSRNC
jgi:hypothetical protein